MNRDRSIKAKYNIVFSLLGQVVVMVCGIIVPQLLILGFGSEAYGATASITQFLAYISLLEGGIGGVARAALYKPLAENDIESINGIIREIRSFFRCIAYIFIVYVIVLACVFKDLAHVQCYDWISTFSLVLVISISIFAQYFIGISYSVFLQAAQKTYIIQIVSIVFNIANTVLVVLLVYSGFNLITVKLLSSVVFAAKPIILWLYVKKHYNLNTKQKSKRDLLTQKWTGLGQHLAYVLHSNTDIAVLTIFADLTYVSVYSVYYMVVAAIQSVAVSFASGMEALFGDMLAKDEIDELNKTFDVYEAMISFVSVILFSVTAVMITPFVALYTRDVDDVDYCYPVFGVLLVLASFLFCFRFPYHSMVIASGSFKQTRVAAYGEAIINLSLSIILVIKFGLVGVAVGTLVAVSFRFAYYVFFLSKSVIKRSIFKFAKRMFWNLSSFICVYAFGNYTIQYFNISDYLHWAAFSSLVVLFALSIQLVILFIPYRAVGIEVMKKLRLIKKR